MQDKEIHDKEIYDKKIHNKKVHDKAEIWKVIRRCLIVVVAIFVVMGIGFRIYVSDYYHAKDFEVRDVLSDSGAGETLQEIQVTQHKGFTVYGNENCENGLIFYPGGKVEATAYEPILYQIANEGICVVLVKMPCNLAVFNMNGADDVMSQLTQVKKWYISGHSLGGAMAANYAAEHLDKLSGVILFAAYPTKSITDIPVLSIYGSEDGVLNREKYAKNITLASKLTEVVIQGGNHGQFGNYGKQSGDGDATISEKEQWKQAVELCVEFIR